MPIPMVAMPFLSALASYFPTSLSWIFLNRLFIHFDVDMRYSTEREGFIIVFIGVLLSTVCYFFLDADWMSFAILIMLAGGDFVFSAREVKSLLEDKAKRNSKPLKESSCAAMNEV